tara:strand:+ start:81 stop:599 length:519 start_codon:yes stop_codon:yes gene_type:complete
MGKKPIVKLRVYRGKQMNYNENGSVQNENQLISVEHKSMQWKLTMKTLPIMGYCKVIVDHVLKDENGKWKEYSRLDVKDYSKEVAEAYSPKSKIPKTADQLRIEQLEAQNKEMMAKMEAFMSGNKTDKIPVVESKDLLKELQDEYFLLYEKKAHHMMKEDRLIEEIDKIKNK